MLLEPLAGAPLDRVHVHTDRKAAAIAAALDATAVTVGQDIFFDEGHYRPESTTGQRLIAHEVAHTVQQRAAAAPQRHPTVSKPGDPLEAEAAAFADASMVGQTHPLSSATTLSFARNDRTDKRGPKYVRDLSPLVLLGIPMVPDEAIEETEEFKSYMNTDLIWQWKYHATQDEGYEACRLILRDLWSGSHVDWDLTATKYLLAARAALQEHATTTDPKQPDPRQPDPRQPDPRQPDPRQPDPRQPDPRQPDPKQPDPKQPDPKQPDPKQPDPKDWTIKDPGFTFPVYGPGGEYLYKRLQRILDDLAARGDVKTAHEIKDLWSGVTSLMGDAARLIGFYVVSMELTEAGELLVILNETRTQDMIFSRVWSRFENDVKGALEKKLGELDRKLDQNEPKPRDPKDRNPKQPDAPKQPETCATAHPDRLLCDDAGMSAYRWTGSDVQSGRATTYSDIKDAILTRDIQMNPTTPAATRDVPAQFGPCVGKGGTHTLVKDVSSGQDITFGSIVCCPCCRDSAAGPTLQARCGFVGKGKWSRLFP